MPTWVSISEQAVPRYAVVSVIEAIADNIDTYTIAFQVDAFQNDAFQTYSGFSAMEGNASIIEVLPTSTYANVGIIEVRA